MKHIIILVLSSFLLSSCATTPDNQDPFMKFNRKIHAFNHDVDRMFLKPIAETYKAITPQPIDKGISNFFNNLDEVSVVVNDVLQMKLEQAASDTGRFVVNSTVGLLGFVDVATGWGLPKHNEDFGQTLGYWGVSSGPYLVLPFLGPATIRDAGGRVVDSFTDPRTYASYARDDEIKRAILKANIIDIVDTRADLMELEKVVDAAAIDNYTFMRDAYLQRREYLVYDGNPPREELDGDFLFDDE